MTMRTTRFLGQLGVRSFSMSPARADLCKLALIGRLGKDLEVKESSKGKEYMRYTIASQTGKEHVSWFTINVLDAGAIAFMTKYLKKGSNVYVEADASWREYEDKDGVKHQTLNLIQQSITPIGWRSKKGQDTQDAE